MHYSIKLGELNRTIYLKENNKKLFTIKIGLGGSKGVSDYRGYFSCGKNSRIIFKGVACFGRGTSIRVDDGILTFGERFSANKNCFFSCTKNISFGSDVLLGFNISIRDSDGHTVFYEKTKKVIWRVFPLENIHELHHILIFLKALLLETIVLLHMEVLYGEI